MAFQNLSEFIQVLDKAGELYRVKTYVNTELEISEITDRISKTPDRNKAILFENTGTDFPVLMNSMGSLRRICLALGVDDLDDIARDIESLFLKLSSPKNSLLDKMKMLPMLGEIASWMPNSKSGRGACQEVVMKDLDVFKLPVIKCWPNDGGAFITLPAIHTKSLSTNTRNIGMYRVQLFEKNLTALHWHKHKVSAMHFNEYKEANMKMPVAIVLGGDPAYTYCATAPLPPNVDEYMMAGFIRKKKVNLVKCLTQDIEVPEDADFVIEGYVDPADDLIWEGPFGDHTGYYSLADWYPRFHITCITHRKQAVYPATIVGIPPQEDAWIGKATERIFIAPIKMTMLPEMVNMELPIEGVFHNLTLVSIDKKYAGHAQKTTNTMWGAGQMMFNKILLITDKHIELSDYRNLAKYVSDHLDPVLDMQVGQGPMDVLDHACNKFAYGGKLSIDGTQKYEEEKNEHLVFDKMKMKRVWNEDVKKKLMQDFYEIKGVHDALVADDISCIFISVHKNKKKHIKELNDILFQREEFEQIKIIIYVEDNLPIDRLDVLVWRFANNYDPKRDTYFMNSLKNEYSHVGLDGTRKSKKYDDFQREWPNIVVMDDATIDSVDQKWQDLQIGDFIPSPSLLYKSQLYGDGAIADDVI